MATTIRLTRKGRKQAPFYRLVVVDSRDRRDGAYIENIGTYNPMPAEFVCEVNATRAIDWLDKGATMSDTARSLLRSEGVLYRWHLKKEGLDDTAIDAKVEEFRAARAQKVADADNRRAVAAAAKLKKAEDEAAAAKKAEQEAKAAAEAEALAAAAAAAAEAAAAEKAAEEAAAAEASSEAPAAEESADDAPAESADAESKDS